MSKILIAEDNQEMRTTLEQIFNFYKFSVITAENGKVAVQKSQTEEPDIILLDAHMPVMDGFIACKKIKTHKLTCDIPVVFLSAKFIEADNKIAGFELGADDYLLKPFNSKELVTRINAILQKNQVLRELRLKNEELSISNIKIDEKLKQLKKSLPRDLTDPLTGLYDHSYFMKRLKEEYNRSLRFNIFMTIIEIKIKDYKKIVSDYGLSLGDYILMKISNVILNNTRVVDISSHYKNGRFRILLPQTDSKGGKAESIRLKGNIESENYQNTQLADLNNVKRKRKIDVSQLIVETGVVTFPAGKKIESESSLLKILSKDLEESNQ